MGVQTLKLRNYFTMSFIEAISIQQFILLEVMKVVMKFIKSIYIYFFNIKH